MNLLSSLKKFVLCVFVITFFSCNTTLNIQEDQSEHINKIDSLMVESHKADSFNGNVLIAKNNTIIYQKSFGFINDTQQKKLDSNSVFNIGSIAKEFNGVAIMMLQERGLLNINDTISKFNLGLPEWSKEVTISHLLNYASGIPSIDPIEPPDDKEAWKIIRSVDTLLFKPGNDFVYDNSNVFLQRRIIEKVTGQSFEKFITENIVNPLGMKSAIFDPTPNDSNRTSCYNWKNGPCPEMEFISGWLWQDIADLHKWIIAMSSNRLISQESFDILLKNPYVDNLTGSIGEYFEKEQLQKHDGTSYRFKSVYLNDFKNDITIILLSNNGTNVIPIAYTIQNLMLDKPYKSIRKALKNDFIKSVDEGIVAYYTLKQKKSKEYNFDDPGELNSLCVDLYRLEKSRDEVIKIFEFGVSEFPNNIRLRNNLGEMYFVNKQYDLALENYKKVIVLDAKNDKAKEMIKKINGLLKK